MYNGSCKTGFDKIENLLVKLQRLTIGTLNSFSHHFIFI